MDDIIVIILMLIFIAASFLGQKKKQKPAPAPEQKAEPEDFWDMLKRQNEEAYMPENAQQQQKVTGLTESDFQHKSKSYDFHPDKEGARTIIAKPKKKHKPAIKSEKEKFSLKKAVIYSEILNRKYS